MYEYNCLIYKVKFRYLPAFQELRTHRMRECLERKRTVETEI